VSRASGNDIIRNVRIVLSFGVLLLMAIGATGQHRGPPGNNPPAIGRPGNPVPPLYPRPPAPSVGRPGADGAGRDTFWHREFTGRGFTAPVPYFVPYPVYVSGGDGADTPQAGPGYFNEVAPAAPAPTVTVVAPPPPPQPPVVEQHAREGNPAVCSEKTSVEPGVADPIRFFIALKDGWVLTAFAYWVEDGTLHYISSAGNHNQVSLELVDRQTSMKLNASLTHGVEFGLPRR
jgi:hypothetical protein